MNETLTNFRQAVADSTDLQEKVKAGADLVVLGKENGYEFTTEELNTGWKIRRGTNRVRVGCCEWWSGWWFKG